MTGLRTYRLWQSIRHRPVVKRTQQPPLTIHCQVAGSPYGWRTNIAGKNCVFGCQIIEHSHDILRMDQLLVRSRSGKLIEALPCLPVMIEGSPQMLMVTVLLQPWQQSRQRRSRVPYKSIVNLGPPSQLLSPDV